MHLSVREARALLAQMDAYQAACALLNRDPKTVFTSEQRGLYHTLHIFIKCQGRTKVVDL